MSHLTTVDEAQLYGTRCEPLHFEFAESAVNLAIESKHLVFATVAGKTGVFEIDPRGRVTHRPAPPKSQAEAEERVAALAGQISDSMHFAQILKSARPEMREELYAEIAPHLKFKPPSYRLLMLMAGRKHGRGGFKR